MLSLDLDLPPFSLLSPTKTRLFLFKTTAENWLQNNKKRTKGQAREGWKKSFFFRFSLSLSFSLLSSRPESVEEAAGGDLDSLEFLERRNLAGGLNDLQRRDRGLGEDGRADRVCEVLGERAERALAGDLRRHGEANEGQHSEAPVLELLDLELGEVAGDEGSKDAARVADRACSRPSASV